MLLGHVVFEELRSDVKLNGVVTSRDGLHIPLNVVVLLSLLDVVNIIDDKKSDKNCSASNRQTLLLSIDGSVHINYAGDLEEHLGVAGATLFCIETCLVALHVPAQIINFAVVLPHTIFCKICFQELPVEEF